MSHFIFVSSHFSLQLLSLRPEASLHHRHTDNDSQVCPPAGARGGGKRGQRRGEGGEKSEDFAPPSSPVCLLEGAGGDGEQPDKVDRRAQTGRGR